MFYSQDERRREFWPAGSPPVFSELRQTLPTNIPSTRTTPGAPQPKERSPSEPTAARLHHKMSFQILESVRLSDVLAAGPDVRETVFRFIHQGGVSLFKIRNKPHPCDLQRVWGD